MVHLRTLDDQELVFGNQGALWGNAMTWWDHDTGSVWSQPLGEAIAGPRKGARLELLPSTLTEWGSWRQSHPETLALAVSGGAGGFRLSTMVIVVDLGDEAAAYPVADLEREGVANDVVAGVPIAVVLDPSNPGNWAVFSRQLDDRTVTLSIDGEDVVDVETGTTWDPTRGVARTGPLQGEVLDLLPAFTAFPGDFPTFWPEGRIWSAP